MTRVHLRALRGDDLPKLLAGSTADDPFQFFGFTATNALERRFAADGLISDDAGHLVVEEADGLVVGSVGWFAVQHGPSSTARALNIGITLLAEHRGRGLGSAAQASFAEYLFANTLVERLEAGTDVENVAEQRALENAGFAREGVARHAQFRAGHWHDLVVFSRLRGDRPASQQSGALDSPTTTTQGAARR
jgi:RimJ/RimL family protein N-acetyltransferase